MSATRAIEYRVIQQILQRRQIQSYRSRVEGLITAIAAVACLGVLATFLPGLLWLPLLGAIVLILGA